jgi:hypothetical protein
MAWVEVPPAAPTKVEGTKPLFERPAGYVPYVPPPIPDAVPETALTVTAPEPAPVLEIQLSWWGNWCRDRARNKMQRTLARIIQISQDHEANGVKPGDRIYQHLYSKALALCHGYFDTWHLNRDHIEIEIPCMRQLRLAAYPEASTVTGSSRVFFGFLAVIVLPLVIGVWTGLFGIGQRWIMHLFGG